MKGHPMRPWPVRLSGPPRDCRETLWPSISGGRTKMTEQPKSRPPQPPLTSVEADLLGALFGFHERTTALLRQPSLNEEKRNVVADRIKTLLDNATAEMKRAAQLNVRERLEAAYDEVKRLVEELSGSPDGGIGG